MDEKVFLCGAAREKITPRVGTELYGYRPGIFSTVVHDDLTVTAVCFGEGKNTAIMISVTVGDINTDFANEVREKVSEATNVPPMNILFCGTHTHSAPNVSGVEGWGTIDREYIDTILLPATIKASCNAKHAMVEAEIGFATGDSFVGVNRRQFLENGDIALGQNPWGTFDPTMTAFVFRNAETKKPFLNLIHYGCHGTACGDGTEITRDWSGPMIDRVEKMTNVMTVFFNGAIGDVGPRLSNGKTVGDITYVDELGGIAACDAMNILRKVKSFGGADLKISTDTVHLPLQKFPDLNEVVHILSEIKNPDELVNIERLRYSHYRDVLEALKSGNATDKEEFTFDMTMVKIGDSVFIPYPYEIFSAMALRLKEYIGLKNVLCLSCVNGYEGYLPTLDQIPLGGYEVGVFRYASLYSLADDTDRNLINETLRIYRTK